MDKIRERGTQMYKRLIITILTAVGLVLGLVASSYADPPGGGWWTAEQIQNVDEDGDANIVLTAYDDGGEHECGGTTIEYGDSFVFVPTDQWGLEPNCGNLPDGFQGSAVVSSDRQIVAMAQIQNQYAPPLGASGGTAVAAYRGMSSEEVATTLLFPTYKYDHSGETTTFYIQNAGSGAADITAVFKEQQGGGVYTYTVPGVESRHMVAILPSMAEDAGGTPMPSGTGRYGGLTVSSEEPLAGVVSEHATTGGTATYLKSTRAFVPSEADTKAYAPAIKTLYGAGGALTKWSGLVVQNASSGEVDVTVVYNVTDGPNAGSVFTDTTTGADLPSGESAFFLAHPDLATGGTASLSGGDLAAATISADGEIVAVVNEETDYKYGGSDSKQYATYSAVPDGSKATTVSVPVYKEHWNGRYHGVVVQNVSAQDATVTGTVSYVGGLTVPTEDLVVAVPVAGGQSVVFFLLSEGQMQSFYPGTTVLSGDPAEFKKTNNGLLIESDQSIVVLANEEDTYMPAYAPATKLDASNFEGFPLN
jgi:hypothetical protein